MLPRSLPGRPAGQSPPRRPPVVTYGLIGVCAVVFVLSPVSGLVPSRGSVFAQTCMQGTYFDRWGVIPAVLWHGSLAGTAPGLPPGCSSPPHLVTSPFLSVLTALFVHGSWLHLLGNMLFLYIFGAGVEERLGPVRYAAFYLLAGYLATFGYAIVNASSTQTLVGASGAIAGVLGAYLYLHPQARVTSIFPFLLFLPLRFPAWLVLGFWFVLQWLAARTGQSGPGVAYVAHITGFAFGFLCAVACYRGRRAPVRRAGKP
jgi:membrane associated rhomboid family serine protease